MTAMPPIAVLAGGLGTRLGALTERMPKSLIPVAGEPFVAHQLRLFRREGIGRVVLCCGHFADAVRGFVGDGARFGLAVEYALDGDRLLGTGGAIRNALPLLGRRFFVTYGDSYLDIPFRPVLEAYRAAGRTGLMTVFHNAGRWDVSNVEFAAGGIVDHAKQPTSAMRHIDYGLSLLDARAFAGSPAGALDLADVFRRLIAAGDMAGFEVTQRFYEIGSPAGLAEADAYIRASTAAARERVQ
jgi:NDP-sugar pyrophosphorylase family protein